MIRFLLFSLAMTLGTASFAANKYVSITISSSPTPATVCPNASLQLGVTSLTTDGGNPQPSYQWYSNTTNSNTGGTAIGGATTNIYSPNTSTSGTYYFYCVVYSGQGGQTLANGPHSNVITVTVSNETLPNCTTPFFPADGATNVTACNDLQWDVPSISGCNTPTGYEVYLGTTSPPAYVGDDPALFYNANLDFSTTYYWQIRPKNSAGAATGCPIWSFTTAPSSNPNYQLTDDATSADPYECVQLTAAANDQTGCSWDANSTLDFASDWTYDWTINLGSNDAGADGMAFVIQNSPDGRCACGAAGGSLAAGGITNSLIVEIDTYLNWEDRDDGLPLTNTDCSNNGGLEPDHLDIWLGGVVNPDTDGSNCTTAAAERVIPNAIALMDGASQYDIENGLDHIMRVSWNSGTNTITVEILNDTGTTSYGSVSYSFDPLTIFGTTSPFFGFTASTGGLNNNQSFCNPQALLLPVEFIGLDARCDNNAVELNWYTASEQNCDYFVIEKSYDGEMFSNVATVPGSGTTQLASSYSWEASERSSRVGYYRLSQVDFNGDNKLLATVTTNCNPEGLNVISTGVTGNGFIIELETSENGVHQVQLIDLSGKLVVNRNVILDKGNHSLKIPENIKQGVYILHIKNSDSEIVEKITAF